MSWADAAERFVGESNRHGSGFETKRVASEQPGRWRRRLGPEQVDTIMKQLQRFPMTQPTL
ncbi:MAG: hypothetical protein M3N28_06260 [Actinomycetota bacterium]|nr:hypothetical protein [Actinomycetota bacterium]